MNIPDSDLPAIRSALRAAKNYNLNVARAGGGGGYKKAAARYDAILKRITPPRKVQRLQNQSPE